MFSHSFFIDFFGIIALMSYVICFIPQIIENYRLKSTKGWNDSFMLMYFFGYISLLYYVFCLDLIISYKLITPIETAAMGVIVVQRLYYESIFKKKFFLFNFIGLTFFSCTLLSLALAHPTAIGHFCGWVSLIMFTMDTTPQIIKIFREKSVEGFSIGFLHIFTFASIAELIIGFAAALPLPTIFIALKNVLSAFIFYIQFWLYQRKNKS
jgi:uncharacterized protein with PQ loop repeat